MTRKGFSIWSRAGVNTFCVSYADGTGKTRTISGIKNRAIAAEIGRSKANEADRVRAGVITATEARAINEGKRAIAQHANDWRKAMKDRGTKESHYEAQYSRVTKVAKLAKALRLEDLHVGKVQSALAKIADDTTPQNACHYYGAVKAFMFWCIKTGRRTANPLIGMTRPQSAGDSFKRQAIPPEKLADLLEATRTRETNAHHKAEDRAMFYAVLAYTGLRRREAESLTPESFSFGDRSIVTVLATNTKNKVVAELTLRPDVAELLRPWVASKKPKRPVFNFGPHWNCEELFKGDCKAAGIKLPAQGERQGVHSLRRLFITEAIRSGGLAAAQEVARHSTPVLTKKYSDLTFRDTDKALAGLPALKRTVTPDGKVRTA